MAFNYSGKVLYANGAPISGVEVRVFDKDAEGKIDDDLTLRAGVSDAGGNFTVRFEPSRYMDFTVIDSIAGVELPFDWSEGGQRGLRVPDLTDIYLPYLQFKYVINGRPRQHTAAIVPFRREFRLPELPPVQFLPSVHGFKFLNSFPGYPLPFSIPALEKLSSVPPSYGLCGGMSAAAYDFVLAGRPIPSRTTAPDRRSKLYQYLYRRAIDSFGFLGEAVVKVGRWSMLPDDTVFGVQKLTYDEFREVKARLDDQNLVVLGLIYERAGSLAEMLQKIWNNHQVLAYRCERISPTSEQIYVYDSNYPGRDDVFILVEQVRLSGASNSRSDDPVFGLKCVQKLGNTTVGEVRGFFAMPYTAVTPPKGI